MFKVVFTFLVDNFLVADFFFFVEFVLLLCILPGVEFLVIFCFFATATIGVAFLRFLLVIDFFLDCNNDFLGDFFLFNTRIIKIYFFTSNNKCSIMSNVS